MGKKAEGNGARRRQRRSFTPEFKAEVIALVRQGERSLPAICRELDLSETAADPTDRRERRRLGPGSRSGNVPGLRTTQGHSGIQPPRVN